MIMNRDTVDLLRVEVHPDRETMGLHAARRASRIIRETAQRKGTVNVMFAAAPSQLDLFAALLADERVPWESINTFHMDEYLGLPADAPQGFGNFLKRELFDQKPFASVHLMPFSAENPEEACRAYAAVLQAYPLDLVCMGIGENGHIAFNDPPDARFDEPETVKVVELEHQCRQQQVNDGCFSSLDEVPTHALTVTIPALMSAPSIVCVVPGPTKSAAVVHMLSNSVTTDCPASILRTHRDAVLYLDKLSAAAYANSEN